MCLAIPGKVTAIAGRQLTVAYPHETRQVLGSDVQVKVGDFVLVQMGIVIKKLSPLQAKHCIAAWTR